MTKYPSELDTDAELPRVDDAVTEIGGQAIDALRQAMLAVEATLGTSPQGSTASLVNRLAVALNDDGTLKASALVAAGLIALPITNSMVGASAAIAESKLDLDVATQVLQNQINSSEVDILALQESFTDIVNDFNQHVDGTAFQHDSFDILLGAVLTGISGTTVGAALTEINSDAIAHAATSAVAAHQAGNIATSGIFGGESVTNVQQALEALDDASEVLLTKHRDDHHANGISNWANYAGGYNSNHQLVPATLGATATALILSGSRNVIDFISLNLESLKVKQGQMLVVQDTVSAGEYIIDDVGPRDPVGSKALLTSAQLEIVGTFPDDGYVTTQIFGQSSLQQFKTTLAPTIHQSDIRVDSVQFARPNAARVLSLGFDPGQITASSTLDLVLGVGPSLIRSITINNLHLDRNGAAASPITLDSVIGRINSVFQNRVDGNAIPAAAYKVGGELMLCHNWNDSSDFYLSVASTGTGNFELGFDGYGANILNDLVRPTLNGKFFVAGAELNDFAQIVDTTATIAGQIFTLNGVDPLAAGVKVGHLLHLKSHSTTSAIGTYMIISVNSTSVTVHKNGGVVAASNVPIEIWHDTAPLDDFNAGGSGNDRVVDLFVDFAGRTGYNQRLEYSDNISNLTIIDCSDNFLAGEHTLTSTVSGSSVALRLTSGGVSGPTVNLPTSVEGQFKIYGQSNIEWLTVDISGIVSSGTNDITIYDHIDEEELLEICTARLDGATTASSIVDKRLFGSVGIDEVREDYTQAYIETPLAELRSSGVVYGFDILEDNYQDLSIFSSNDYGVLLRGGVAYVAGVRLDVPTAPVMLPTTAGTYYIGVNTLGQLKVISSSDYTLEQLLDGYGGQYAFVAKSVHSGAGVDPLASTDLRFFINSLDDKVELILDTTNRRIGNFASADAAIEYVANYPHDERFRIRIVSITQDNITIPTGVSNIVLEIDGAVGTVSSASNCRIIGSQPLERSIPHIRGSLTTTISCTEFHMDQISVGGTVNIGSTGTAARTRISNCRFAGILRIHGNDTQLTNCTQLSTGTVLDLTGAGEALITGCRFAGAKLLSVPDVLTVTDTIFTGASGFLSAAGSRTIVENCIFDGTNGSGSGAITAGGATTFSNCFFKNITQSSGNFIAVSSSTALVSIVASVFKTIVLSSTAALATLSSGALKFVDCDFSTCTFTTNPFITCSDFEGNRYISPVSGNFLVKMIGSGKFSRNRGVHAVTTGTASADGPVFISQNVFPGSTLGYNVDISQATTSGLLAQAIVSNNHFTSVQNDAILCGANTQYAIISQNIFEGGAGSNAINLGSVAFQMEILGNVVDCDTFIASGSSANSLYIADNFMLSGATTTIQVGTTFSMTNNKLEADLTLSGGSVSSFTVCGNVFSTLTISVAVSGGIISGNKFSVFSFGANISNAKIDGNIFGTFSLSGTPTFNHVKFASNDCTGSMTGLNTLRWTDCLVTGNTYLSPGNFSMVLGDGTQISNNVYDGAPSITLSALAGGVIINMVLSQNSFDGAILQISDELESCIVSDNLDAVFEFSGNLSDTIIANNNATDGAGGWIFGGALVNSVVVGNSLDDFTISASSISGLLISDNHFAGNTAISTTSTIDSLSICKNVSIAGTLTVSSDTTITKTKITSNTFGATSVTATTSMSNLIIAENNLSSTLNVTATTVLQKFSVNGNNIVGNFDMLAGTNLLSGTVSNNFFEAAATIGFNALSDIHFIGNVVSGNATVDPNAIGTTITRLNFSFNTISGTLTLPSEASWGIDNAQSKFFANFATTWTLASGTLDTTGDDFLFPWGNTGSALGSITFGGTAATNTATCNNIGAAGITC